MSIFDYGSGGKRKIGHSDFNMSFQNIHSSTFGELGVVGCYEVLAGDKWKIAQNSLTKVLPMPAPAYTRIKQNFYAYFVANQSIWKHWNDFFTNGTSYLDTYGNNQTNQEISNQWRIPSIGANDLQLIGKVANGWAAPVYRLTSAEVTKLNKLLYRHESTFSYSFTLPKEQFIGGSSSNRYFSDESLWSLLVCTGVFRLPEFFSRIPYIHPKINVSFGSVDSNNNLSMIILEIQYFVFSCDTHTAKEFYDWLNQSLTDNVDLPVSGVVQDSTMNQSSDGVESSYGNSSYVMPLMIRYWCNLSDDYCRVDDGPFMLTKYSYNAGFVERGFINTYKLEKNIARVKHQEFTQKFYHDGSDSSDFYWIDFVQDRCYFWSREFGIIWDNARTAVQGYVINGIFFWNSADTYSIDDVPYIMDYSNSNLDYYSKFCGVYYLSQNSVAFGIPVGSVYNVQTFSDFYSISSQTSDHYVSPFTLLYQPNLNVPNNVYGFTSFSSGFRSSCDVYFPVFSPVHITNSLLYGLPVQDLYTSSDFSIGFDSWGMMVNSCKKCSRNLDRFNIPQEGYVSRSWEHYAGELVNALPFFANSKNYNSYFRNKTTTSAELDFKYSNGVACMDYVRFNYLNILKGLGFSLSPQVTDILDNELISSWVIPMSTAPKTGLSQYTTEFTSSDIFLEYTRNNYHYYNIQSYYDLFSILTGWNITESFVNKILTFNTKRTISNTIYIQLTGLLLDNVYLPNYYNGLLRQKYQNFSKDYFSSCVLDPMHGANDVALGSTVNELRGNVAQQGFWESSAMLRSISRFFQKMVGTTPSHGDEIEPILLGMDHVPVNIGEVVQTSESSESSPQGRRSGLGGAHGKSGLCKHYFNEQGYIIIYESFTLEQQYFQGLEKMWTPFRSFLDYPFIDFVGLGNESVELRQLKWQPDGQFFYGNTSLTTPPQTVYDPAGSKVLYDGRTSPLFIDNIHKNSDGTRRVDVISNVTNPLGNRGQNATGFNEIFGYLPRFSSYKVKFDQVHGMFRDQLDYWQSFRKFYHDPMLVHEFVNWEFVQEDGELRRLFTVQDDDLSDKFLVDTYINAKVTRALPVVCRPSKSL